MNWPVFKALVIFHSPSLFCSLLGCILDFLFSYLRLDYVLSMLSPLHCFPERSFILLQMTQALVT